MRTKNNPEIEVARPVVTYFESIGYTVYKEVQYNHGARADIVAVHDGRVVVVECKTTLGLAVMEQALFWRGLAHWVYVAVPQSRQVPTGRRFAERVLRDYGIGCFRVDTLNQQCRAASEPVMNRKAKVKALIDSLSEQQRTYSDAGNARSEYWTPYRQTCLNLRWYVDRNPGCSLKDAIADIRHHYSSPGVARSSLLKWIESGSVPGVKLERDGKKVSLYPV